MLLHSRTAGGGAVALLALPLLILLLAPGGAAHAQINIGGANPLTYTQNFDSLPSSPTGTTLTFTDNGTITGLYSDGTAFRASNGTSATGALYSFGGDSERALGSVASDGTNAIVFGFRFVNTGTTALTGFTASYTGELWRLGLNSAENHLLFDYAVFSAGAGSIEGSGYTGVSSLDYVEAGLTGSSQAGTVAPIRTQSLSNGSGTSVTVNPGEELWLRWTDVNDSGNDSGLAIDDLSVAFQSVALPEPGTLTLAMIAAPLLGGLTLRRRRRRKQR